MNSLFHILVALTFSLMAAAIIMVLSAAVWIVFRLIVAIKEDR